MPDKRPGNSQGLSRWALARKRLRDLIAAKTEKRKKRKRENQIFVDADGNKGQKSDSDIHHVSSGTQRRVKTAYNRATYTRNEIKNT